MKQNTTKLLKIQCIAVMVLVLCINASGVVLAQEIFPEEENTQKTVSRKYFALIGGMYGYAYPIGSVNTIDGYCKREWGKYFGSILDIGYELSPYCMVHGGFTLWDTEVYITRHLLGQELKTRYSQDTCALHTGVMFVYKWLFADCMLYTELPLEDDAENVYLDGNYVQTNTLQSQYEYGIMAGLGVRIPVIDGLFIVTGIYGECGFVPSIKSTRGDELYIIHTALRLSVMVYAL